MTAVLENLDVSADGREKHPAESVQFRHTTSQFQIFRPVLPLPRCDLPTSKIQHLMLDIGKSGRIALDVIPNRLFFTACDVII